MNAVPRSVRDETAGMMYFPRLLDKIRLHDAGELRADLHANLGLGADSWCTGFLRVSYTDLRERTLEGGADEEILAWCFKKGRALDKTDLFIWNQCIQKLGWRDKATPHLEKCKAESGLAHRDDLVTMPDYFDVDEGRRP